MPNATKILSDKRVMAGGYIMDIAVWHVPVAVPPCAHPFKYRLFFGREGVRMISYDNERGKGDHKHIHEKQYSYVFTSLRQLLADFRDDVQAHCDVEVIL